MPGGITTRTAPLGTEIPVFVLVDDVDELDDAGVVVEEEEILELLEELDGVVLDELELVGLVVVEFEVELEEGLVVELDGLELEVVVEGVDVEDLAVGLENANNEIAATPATTRTMARTMPEAIALRW